MSNARIQRSTTWKWLKPRLSALGFQGTIDDTLRRERGGFVDRFAWEVVGGKSGSFPKLEVSVGVDSVAVAEALAATEPRSGLPKGVEARRPMQCSIPLLRFEEESVRPLGMTHDSEWPLVKGADPTSVLEEAWQLFLDRALPCMEAVRDVEGFAALLRRYARRVSDWLEVAISLALGQRDNAAVVLNEMLTDPERLAQRGKYAIQHEESRAPLRSLLRELRPQPDPEPVDRAKLRARLGDEGYGVRLHLQPVFAVSGRCSSVRRPPGHRAEPGLPLSGLRVTERRSGIYKFNGKTFEPFKP